MVRIMLDTNVLVSGLLNPLGPPGRIVDLILAGAVQIAYDDRILAEYEQVLTRPRFGLPAQEVRALVQFLRLSGFPVNAPPLSPLEAEHAPDPDDLPFAEVALAGEVTALVTGNTDHFAFLGERLRIPTPARFLG